MRWLERKHRRTTAHEDRTQPAVVEELEAVSDVVTTVLLIACILFFAWDVAGQTLFAGARRGDAFDHWLSIPGAVLSLMAVGFAYRSARIATRLERSPAPGVSDLEHVRAHEAESAVLMRALEVFGDSQRALQWMRESNPALKNEPPIRAVQTEDGRYEVLNILGRIQHGVIS